MRLSFGYIEVGQCRGGECVGYLVEVLQVFPVLCELIVCEQHVDAVVPEAIQDLVALVRVFCAPELEPSGYGIQPDFSAGEILPLRRRWSSPPPTVT